MLEDLSELKSFLYIDSNEVLDKADKSWTIGELVKASSAEFEALLPTIVNSIGWSAC